MEHPIDEKIMRFYLSNLSKNRDEMRGISMEQLIDKTAKSAAMAGAAVKEIMVLNKKVNDLEASLNDKQIMIDELNTYIFQELTERIGKMIDEVKNTIITTAFTKHQSKN